MQTAGLDGLWSSFTGKSCYFARPLYRACMREEKKNVRVLRDRALNKSNSFSREERDELGLRGLLPYAINNQATQIDRIFNNLKRCSNDLERYILLSALQDRNERLFYKLVLTHIEDIMPLIYTPTVGQACKEFSHIFRHTQGFYLNPEDQGQMAEIMCNWPQRDIRVIVVTDGQRILGLGDLGANGMGIPIGKLALYCACAGIHPSQCLPVMLDVGTNNETFLQDPLYIGYPSKRITGELYEGLVEEFVQAVQINFPKALIQFEDFLTPNAIGLLRKYQKRVLCFNDDIQGTASVVLSGVYASTRITGKKYKDLRIMFLGAGSAATGIADLMLHAFESEGLSKEEAKRRLWFCDGKGLVVASRTDLVDHKLPYAHEHGQMDFIRALKDIKPDVLIGATAQGGSFSEEAIRLMSEFNEKPVIFALSNPTSNAECTAEQAYLWSGGRAVFASGSPFKPVSYEDKTIRTGQGNNAYIFPGVGLGVIVSETKQIPDEMFLVAAKTLAKAVSEKDIREGALYPPLSEIRRVSKEIAMAVATFAYDHNLTRNQPPADLELAISEYMYDPSY